VRVKVKGLFRRTLRNRSVYSSWVHINTFITTPDFLRNCHCCKWLFLSEGFHCRCLRTKRPLLLSPSYVNMVKTDVLPPGRSYINISAAEESETEAFFCRTKHKQNKAFCKWFISKSKHIYTPHELEVKTWIKADLKRYMNRHYYFSFWLVFAILRSLLPKPVSVFTPSGITQTLKTTLALFTILYGQRHLSTKVGLFWTRWCVFLFCTKQKSSWLSGWHAVC